jgi:hypothetical protein
MPSHAPVSLQAKIFVVMAGLDPLLSGGMRIGRE